MEIYEQPIEEIFKILNSNSEGLTEQEAKKRLEKYGLNQLKEKKKINPLVIFFKQFKSFIIYILLFAVLISLLTREYIDSAVIGAILVFNALFGFIQEYKAEKSIEALKKLSALKTRVLRDEKIKEIDAKELVPGDIIILEEGDKIPADARIIEQKNLRVLESSLTGESSPSSKTSDVLKGNLALADRKNMLFCSTLITKGRGKALVVSTAMDTEIGKIATLINEVEKEQTPLQKRLNTFGKYIGGGVITIAVIIFIIGGLKENIFSFLFSGQFAPFLEHARSWLLTAIALAVAAVPEGLPAIVTVSLAFGVKRMLTKNALIRRLPSIETLGSTTVICSDKTGTLTKNEMTVTKAYTNLKEIEITGSGYDLNGKITYKEKPITNYENLLFKIGALCNNASFNINSDSNSKNKIEITGDPTEISLLISAKKAGMSFQELQKEWKRIDEEPFEAERKMMSTLNKDPKQNKLWVFTKGAPEEVLKCCTKIFINGKIKTLDSKTKSQILKKNEDFAKGALRILAFAYKQYDSKSLSKNSSIEKELIFVGLQGMIDPPRDEVRESIQKCNEAGIKVIMVTGDNRYTAEAIAKQIGISGESINGVDFSKLTEKEKQDRIENISIFSRVDPEHKLEIIKLLQGKGHICAMTGDGVNDAPALKKADIGIAMGIKGTDVAKESSDMILTDDNFASIVNSVEEGRGIYDNISKFINYLLSSNIAEVLIIFIAIILSFPLPLTAIMLLWINLVTDGFPALALSADPYSEGIMKRPPKKSAKQMLGKDALLNMIYVAVLITIAVLFLFYLGFKRNYDIKQIQTIAFTGIIIMEFARIYMIRAEYKIKVFSNAWLIIAIIFSIILQIIVIYTPISKFFGTFPITLTNWIEIIGATAIVFIISTASIKLKDKFNKSKLV
ncbi:MAG: cation-translocating P-type ATPase [Candidatus Pacearchaeota archaeon]|nr:cation-translocating P-type ATPase [Candidatus Pacearchaeota archaeon]